MRSFDQPGTGIDSLIEELLGEKDRLELKWPEEEFNLWLSGTPLNMAEDDDADDDDDDSSDDDDDDDDSDDDDDDSKPATKADLKKAWKVAREAEARAAKAEKRASKAERSGLSEAEKAQQERDEAMAEAGRLQEELESRDRDKILERVAKSLKFKHTDADKVKRFVDSDSKDEAAIRSDLKDALKDYPEMKAGGAPPPEIDDDDSKNGSKKGNAAMNQNIRRMAGRA